MPPVNVCFSKEEFGVFSFLFKDSFLSKDTFKRLFSFILTAQQAWLPQPKIQWRVLSESTAYGTAKSLPGIKFKYSACFLSNVESITQLQLVGLIHFLHSLASLSCVKHVCCFFGLFYIRTNPELGLVGLLQMADTFKCDVVLKFLKTKVKCIRHFHIYWRNIIFMLAFFQAMKLLVL